MSQQLSEGLPLKYLHHYVMDNTDACVPKQSLYSYIYICTNNTLDTRKSIFPSYRQSLLRTTGDNDVIWVWTAPSRLVMKSATLFWTCGKPQEVTDYEPVIDKLDQPLQCQSKEFDELFWVTFFQICNIIYSHPRSLKHRPPEASATSAWHPEEGFFLWGRQGTNMLPRPETNREWQAQTGSACSCQTNHESRDSR